GGNKEVIADGKNGLIAHSGDENDWKEKIIIALRNQWIRKGYGENLRKDILKDYSLDKVSEIVEKEYKSILKAHQ
ncbi:MAG TPA: glycosyltransferase family 4 protein, partial [Candidatus Nanoarchaeia archaeon]|nr:glycosyltransferase family 4 protein [Candidatus Nanoarchaeia archaeon]